MWSTLAALLAAGPATAPRLVGPDGGEVPLAVTRWCGPVSAAERALLAGAVPPVLDVGCGPGRVPAYLAGRGVQALGIDVAPAAVLMTRARGAAALRRSVFGPVPGAGTWATAVLLDGNLGIGGDPRALLRRVAQLLTTGGRVLCDVEPPGTPSRRLLVRLDDRAGNTPWAQVGADDLAALARAAGLTVADLWSAEGRWFARLDS